MLLGCERELDRSSHRTLWRWCTIGLDECIIVMRAIKLASEGKLQPIMDSRGPFPFNTEAVQAVPHLQESSHAHGKVIIHAVDD